MQWAAHIRLTPELLLKLQQAPEQVLLTLNASSADARKNTKKTSLLSVGMGASAAAAAADSENGLERYELHSFQEDPRVNYLCTFRQDGAHRKPAVAAKSESDTSSQVGGRTKGASGGGFSVYTTGKIYQKLIVQRMLDSTEKGRMKDRHAQSVIESRSRASKLLEDEPLATGKRKRVSLFSTQFSKTPDAKAVDAPLRKMYVQLLVGCLLLHLALTLSPHNAVIRAAGFNGEQQSSAIRTVSGGCPNDARAYRKGV